MGKGVPPCPPPSPLQQITIGIINLYFASYTVHYTQEKKIFLKNGLQVNFKSYLHGKASLAALNKGEIDFAVSSETPFVNAAMHGAQIRIVAQTVTAKNHLAIVGRPDLGVKSVQDLAGKKVGITLGSNGEFFLDLVLQLNLLPNNTLEKINLVPANMLEALTQGKVSAIVTWNPTNYIAQLEIANPTIIDANDLYAPLFIVATHQRFIETQSRWARKKIVGSVQPIPNYLDYIYIDALEAVDRPRVTIIR